MAKYTIELRKVCEIYTRPEVENWFKNYKIEDYLTKEQINSLTIQGTWTKEKLAKKIIDHYYMREIGFETPALFKHYSIITMQEIMEEKLPFLYANSLKYDPLSTIDYTEEFEREIEGEAENEGKSNSNSNNKSSNLNIMSDTPQGEINKTEILKGEYATSTSGAENDSEIKDNTITNSKGTSKNIEKWKRRKYGDDAVIITNQYLVEQYRKIVMAVDKDIIKELNILFMGLY